MGLEVEGGHRIGGNRRFSRLLCEGPMLGPGPGEAVRDAMTILMPGGNSEGSVLVCIPAAGGQGSGGAGGASYRR